MTRIPFTELVTTIQAALMAAGMKEAKAATCARIHAESSRDGVASHGLNRVERFVEYLHKGFVIADAVPTLHWQMGMMEIYNGHLGPGVLNALFAVDRAAELAAEHGIGMVSLNNTTHWMRGGTYGWRTAEKGLVSICWTNTESCMPAWGGQSEAIGNNPFIIAVPHNEGAVVLDMAMSQYSYGKLITTQQKKERLPFPGGYDAQGNITDDPAAIEQTRRLLPMGYWKGSGMAVMLDLLAALLSGGLTTSGIDQTGKGVCGRCCQVFITIDPLKMNTQAFLDHALAETITQLQSSVPVKEGEPVYYPGQQTWQKRKENEALGVPVDDTVWARVRALAGLA